MNWGHRFKQLITRNWREKLISLLLAFLFWFMIKAQDVRHTQPYMVPPPVRLTPSTSSPAPSQLAPVFPPPAEAPSQLEPVVTPPAPAPGLGRAAGL